MPIRRIESQGDGEIEFHGVSTATFEGLCDNNSSLIEKYEKENNCIVEINEEIALITIHCSKEQEKSLKEKF